MIRTVLLIVFCCLSFCPLQAQHALSYEVDFQNSSTTEKGAFLSKTHKITEDQHKLPFIGISAYCKDLSVKANIYYRLQSDQQWGAWIPFREFTEGTLTDRVAYEGPPITQKINAIQFKSDQKLTEKMIFRLFFPTGAKKKTTSGTGRSKNLENSCNCAQPDFCGRDCWCPSGNCPPDRPPVSTMPTHLIVHHSAGFNSSDNFPAVVAYYWDLHVNTNGWDDIGYNWLIDAEGVIYEGRGDERLGAHFSCMNGNTVGICMIGDFRNVDPSAAAVQKLKDWLAWEACSKGIDPAMRHIHQPSQLNLRSISGHRDGNTATAVGCPKGTVCPGGRLYSQLDAIAADVAAYACLNGVPDIVIRDMWTEPAEPMAGDTVDLYVSIKNVGAGPAEDLRWEYQIDEQVVKTDSLPTLDAGETQTRFFDNYIFPEEGSYKYCVYIDAVNDEPNSANNSFCKTATVSGTVSVTDSELFNRLWLFPNPSNGQLQVEMIFKVLPETFSVQVINGLGQTVLKRNEKPLSQEWNIELDLHSLPVGSYYLRIDSELGRAVNKIVKF